MAVHISTANISKMVADRANITNMIFHPVFGYIFGVGGDKGAVIAQW